MDASINNDGVIGIGLIARDCFGDCVGWRGITINLPLSPEASEALAALRAVEFSLEKGWRNLIIEGDCLSVIQGILDLKLSAGVLGSVFEDINVLAKDFHSFKALHVFREHNVAAHSLAKLASTASSLPRDLDLNAAGDDERVGDKKHCFPMKRILLMETNWYSSPEEISGGSSSCASDIYQLGVLLFEVSCTPSFTYRIIFPGGFLSYEQLFCTFGSIEEKSTSMASLRHHVLPPQLLLKWPKEASFCLWILHLEPSSRPKMSDLLQSDFLNEPRDEIEEREAAIELRENIEEQELLFEFLLLLQQRKKDAADSYNEIISFMSSDIEEVAKLQKALQVKKGSSFSTNDDDSGSSGSRKKIRRVSYVKFIDSTTLVSASTDNTVKLWDLSTCTSRVLDCPHQSFTGHLNVKNFVGLFVSEGYIATGSETNERRVTTQAFVYHNSLPMPALSYKFSDPLSGDEVDDSSQFISSVCWRGQSSTLVAANSMGNIKLLDMV
ncbi:hypothetical protein RD792_006532 [Penstemon davidsonii]|uniref:RNase H type-1 domain-containing protein n=1 Tax=Penstemon davidsonii TaxID=160366 RepID=A0ABR0DDA4_9LAMI|nr:hypothetical protein RD792_006532 [Penstemon davidsonii]